jgi:DNA mismatch repair protein MSH4
MSIASKMTAFPGSDPIDDLNFATPFLDNTSKNTSAMLSNDGSRYHIKSISALSAKDAEAGHWVVAMIDSRGPSGEVGVAAMSSLTTECIVIELSDTARFTKTLRFLTIHEPGLLITCDTPNSRLASTLVDAMPGVPLQKMQRSWFNDRAGKKAIDQYAPRSSLEHLLVALDKRFYALASLGALIHWVEDGGDRITPHSLSIKCNSGEDGIMIIDYHSSKYLEIVKSVDGAKDKGSNLLNAVDTTRTAMGKRLLRSNLLQPLTGNFFNANR